jgi:hypothetical protein
MGGTAAITGNTTIGGTATIGGNTAITGTLSATQDVTFTGTGQLTVPAGTTGQRSALPTVGMTRYNRTTNVYESYVGVAGQTISSITFVSTTATLTTSSVHGLSNGDVVTISGASPSNYNGTYSITVTGTSTFTYVMATAPSTNATVVGTYTSGAWQTSLVNSATAVGQIPFSTNGTTFTPTAKIVSGTAVASTSGTSINFTDIPSWVKRITVMFNSVSTNGTSLFLIQLGDSGGIENTGYLSGAGSRAGETTNTAGFVLNTTGAAAQGFSGINTIALVSANLWVSSGNLNRSGTGGDGFLYVSSGTKTVSDTLDRVRVTTVNGTDTFDAGSINILYE